MVQPCDLSVGELFRSGVRKKYMDCVSNNYTNIGKVDRLLTPCRKDIPKWVGKSWYRFLEESIRSTFEHIEMVGTAVSPPPTLYPESPFQNMEYQDFDPNLLELIDN